MNNATHHNTFRLAEMQGLETRTLMSATVKADVPVIKVAVVPQLTTTVAVFGEGQQLRISGTTGNDQIKLTTDGATFTVTTTAGYSKSFSGNFNSIKINGGAGNDSIEIDAAVALPCYLVGSDGNDTLSGGSGNDNLYGGNGNDVSRGNAGNDTIVTLGGGTVDLSTGGAGADYFWVDSNETEKVTDPSAGDSVQRISAFESTTFTTGTKVNPVSKEPTGQRFRDPIPDAGLTYKQFADKPLFSSVGPTSDDVRQGGVGDCYFLAGLAAVAGVNPAAIQQSVADLGDGTYAVKFGTSTGGSKFFRVDNDLATYGTFSTSPAYAKLGQGQSMWVAVMEKAFAHFRRNQSTYSSLNSGWMSEAFTALSRREMNTSMKTDGVTGQQWIAQVEADLAAGRAVTMAVMSYAGPANLVNGHAYQVVRIDSAEDGTKSLVVRNPWGIDNYNSYDGNNDGYVTLTADQTKAAVAGFVSTKAA